MTTTEQAQQAAHNRRLLVEPMKGGGPPVILIDVFGTPRPQGSMRLVQSKDSGRPVLKYAPGVYEWRTIVTGAVREAWSGPRIEGAVMMAVTFELERPRGHFGTGRNATQLRPSAPLYPANGADLDKLIRAVGDAVTDAGTVWHDDSQLVRIVASKIYASPPTVPGCSIRICAAAT